MSTDFANDIAESIRKELSDYLDDVRSRKDDEGNPTVHFPSNFDFIAASMGRKDLELDIENIDNNNSNSKSNNNTDDKDYKDKNWSKALFSDALNNFDNIGGEKGRYKTIISNMNEENKIDKGMAQITMLDKQLKALINKEKETKNNIEMLIDDQLLTNRSNNSTPGSTPRTVRSLRMDTTFLTRGMGPDSKTNTPYSSAPSTARSRLNDGNDDDMEAELDELHGMMRDMQNANATGMNTGRKNKKINNIKDRNRNFISENIKKAANNGKSKLTVEQEYRVRELTLDGEMGEKMMENLSNYGMNEMQKQKLNEINNNLSLLAAADSSGLSQSLMQRLSEVEVEAQSEAEAEKKVNMTIFDDDIDENENNQSSSNGSIRMDRKKKGNKTNKAKAEIEATNVIRQNQIERARKEYMTQIDTALDTIKDEPLDFANMLDDNNSGTTGNDEYDVNSNLNYMQRCKQLTNEKLQDFIRTTVTSASSTSIDTNTDTHNVDSHSNNTSSGGSNVNRAALDRLLFSIRSDRDQLALLRGRQLGTISGSSASSPSSTDYNGHTGPETETEMKDFTIENSVNEESDDDVVDDVDDDDLDNIPYTDANGNAFTDAYAEIEYLEQQLLLSQQRTQAQQQQFQQQQSNSSSRPSSAARSRPSSAARSRPSSAARSRPSSAASRSSEYEYYNGHGHCYGIDNGNIDSIDDDSHAEGKHEDDSEGGVKLPLIKTKSSYKQ